MRLRGIPGTDRYNNETLNWDDPAQLPLARCNVQPQPVEEFTDARQTLEDRQDVWHPDPDADVTGRDRIEWRGKTYEIDGEPQRWRSGRRGHLKFTMKESSG